MADPRLTVADPTAPTASSNARIREQAAAMDRIVARIAADPDLPDDVDAQQALQEALKYLEVAATSDCPASPSKVVDIAWHHFILFTRDFMDHCATHLGRFVHHVPDEPDTADGTAEHDHDTYLRTRRLLQERFGSLDEELWPDVDALADCQSEGNCSSECSGECSGS